MEFTVLLDAPAKAVSRIQIAKLGTFDDPRYGEFDITAANVANWQKNLSKLPGGEALIDFEHRSERKPRDSKAAGWISGINLDGDRVMADARWTPGGQQAIESETYRFLSPVFGPALGTDNQRLDDALPSVALTNKPVLGLPALMLASEGRVSEAIDEDPALRFHVHALDGDYGEHTRALVLLDVSQAERDKAHAAGNSLPDKSYPINNAKQLHAAAVLAASGHGDTTAARKLIRRRAGELGVDIATLPGFASDSRRSMATETTNPTLLTLLDLDTDATDDQIVQAVTSLKDASQIRTLEQQAADEGKVVLDADQWDKTRKRAKEGADALERVKTLEQQAATERFDSTFNTALRDKKVTEAERDSIKRFYELDADAAITMLDQREPIMAAQPGGQPALDLTQLDGADPEQVMRAGRHPDSHQLDRQIQKYLLDKGLPPSEYVRVFEQVQEGSVRLDG